MFLLLLFLLFWGDDDDDDDSEGLDLLCSAKPRTVRGKNQNPAQVPALQRKYLLTGIEGLLRYITAPWVSGTRSSHTCLMPEGGLS